MTTCQTYLYNIWKRLDEIDSISLECARKYEYFRSLLEHFSDDIEKKTAGEVGIRGCQHVSEALDAEKRDLEADENTLRTMDPNSAWQNPTITPIIYPDPPEAEFKSRLQRYLNRDKYRFITTYTRRSIPLAQPRHVAKAHEGWYKLAGIDSTPKIHVYEQPSRMTAPEPLTAENSLLIRQMMELDPPDPPYVFAAQATADVNYHRDQVRDAYAPPQQQPTAMYAYSQPTQNAINTF